VIEIENGIARIKEDLELMKRSSFTDPYTVNSYE